MACFIAIILAVGFLKHFLIAIPNVELVTMTIFLAGYILGSLKGTIIGVVAEFLYSILSPYGIASLPLLLAQMLAMGIVGYWGGLLFRFHKKFKNEIVKIFSLGLAGFFLTVLFDILTTLSFSIFMAESIPKIFASFVASFTIGLPFSITHILLNTIIFMTLLPLICRALIKIEYFKTISSK
jgi:uncharacterized membrane protein